MPGVTAAVADAWRATALHGVAAGACALFLLALPAATLLLGVWILVERGVPSRPDLAPCSAQSWPERNAAEHRLRLGS